MGTVEVALIIHGAGLDEISPLGRSKIIEVRNTNVNSPGEGEEQARHRQADRQTHGRGVRRVRAWCLLSGPKKYEKKVYELDPESLGVPTCTIEDLKGGGWGGEGAMPCLWSLWVGA